MENSISRIIASKKDITTAYGSDELVVVGSSSIGRSFHDLEIYRKTDAALLWKLEETVTDKDLYLRKGLKYEYAVEITDSNFLLSKNTTAATRGDRDFIKGKDIRLESLLIADINKRGEQQSIVSWYNVENNELLWLKDGVVVYRHKINKRNGYQNMGVRFIEAQEAVYGEYFETNVSEGSIGMYYRFKVYDIVDGEYIIHRQSDREIKERKERLPETRIDRSKFVKMRKIV
jgi:hypothetical protein